MIRSLALVLLLSSIASAQTAEELRTHVEYFASDELEGRKAGSEGMEVAISYVKKECKKLGLPVFHQPVKIRSVTCRNTIAVLKGHTDTRIVIGAHLDHIGKSRRGIYNGADDNASGSAAVLGLAKRLKAGPIPGCTIEFHWYTGEEDGMYGSEQYTRKPLVPIAQYKFMLNLDMIGRLDSPQLIGTEHPFDAELTAMYNKYSFAKKITIISRIPNSDHSSWWQAGVPAIFLHTGLHRDYHRTTDDANKINYAGMQKVCQYAHDLTLAIDRRLSPQPNTPNTPTPPPVILY